MKFFARCPRDRSDAINIFRRGMGPNGYLSLQWWKFRTIEYRRDAFFPFRPSVNIQLPPPSTSSGAYASPSWSTLPLTVFLLKYSSLLLQMSVGLVLSPTSRKRIHMSCFLNHWWQFEALSDRFELLSSFTAL
jgi:hypothetical protein